jgi:hypothetical protein
MHCYYCAHRAWYRYFIITIVIAKYKVFIVEDSADGTVDDPYIIGIGGKAHMFIQVK